MGKRALALGGGGARGAYEVGVWKALREIGQDRFDIITGTSVGALNGAVIAQGSYEDAVRFWSGVTTEKVLRIDLAENGEKEALSEHSLSVIRSFTREILRNRGADTAPLREMLTACVDEAAVRASGTDFGLVTVSLPDGKGHGLFLPDIPEGKLIDYLMASSAFFPAMQVQMIDGIPYVDGGYYDNVPAAMAAERGAEEIVAVDLKAPGLHRSIPVKGVRVIRIEPSWDLGPVLLFGHAYVERNITLGYFDTLRAFDQCDGVLYAFQKGEAAAYGDACRKRIFSLYETLRPEAVRPLGERAEPLKWRVMRVLRGLPWNGDAPLAVGWMENAGRIFGVSPLRKYTAREFYAAAKEICVKQPALAFSELESWTGGETQRKDPTGMIRELLKTTDRRAIAGAFYEQIVLSLHDEAERRRLWAAALLFPAEAAAGAYLACSYESL